MVEKITILGQEFDANGFPGVGKELRELATRARASGVPEDFPAPELPVQKEVPTDYLEILRAKYEGAMERPEFYTPDFQTQFWKDMLADDPSIVVPECDWTEENMRKPMVDVKGNLVTPMMVYKPEAFRGKEGLVRLGKRYPKLGSSSVQEKTTVTDEYDNTGWIKVEATLNAPNLNTTENDLTNHAKDHGYHGQREGTYVFMGQALYVLTGQYPDIRTVSRLPGSRDGRCVISANRSSDGSLSVYWYLVWKPRAHDPYVGGRFEEVKSA